MKHLQPIEHITSAQLMATITSYSVLQQPVIK